VRHQQELALVAVPHWHGQPLYRSYLITGADSALRGVSELRGRTFAYSDPLSNSGFLYVQHLLRSQGQEPGRYFGRSFFTHSHRHVVDAVADGLADAGAVDGYVWETLTEVQPQLTARTRVLHRSGLFGFPPIVAAPSTGAALRGRFQKALLGMDGSATGRAVLAEMRLDRFASESTQLFRTIAAMAREQ
jgi:phosphonate transport system substrate-binding protein